MDETAQQESRRKLLGAVGNGIAATFLLRIAPMQASEKMTRQQAEYQDTPNGIYSCATCSLFEPPQSCKVVAGEIGRDGWCKAFALAD